MLVFVIHIYIYDMYMIVKLAFKRVDDLLLRLGGLICNMADIRK